MLARFAAESAPLLPSLQRARTPGTTASATDNARRIVLGLPSAQAMAWRLLQADEAIMACTETGIMGTGGTIADDRDDAVDRKLDDDVRFPS